MSALVLGIDVGTTAIKAALFSADALQAPIAVARRASVVTSPAAGYSEADPIAVRDAVAACVTALTADTAHAGAVAAVGISGTACGAWLIADGAPVRPAILWNDARAAPIVARWAADGRLAEIAAISGNVPFPGYTLSVLRWLIENEPPSLGRASRLVFCKDFLRGWLTGVFATDETDASYAPCDIRARSWSAALAEITETATASRLLPEILPPGRTDPLLPDVARALGLRSGIPIALGATDVVAGCVGGGAVKAGRAVVILGTSACSSVITDAPEFAPSGIGVMAAAPLGRWARTMINTAGSMTLDWAARLFAGGDVGAMLAAAAKADLSEVPVLLPYLSGAGVVSPFVEAEARGAFFGLRAAQELPEMARAAVDGLAFAVADCFEAIPVPVHRITAIGGAARSELLLQTIADATGAIVLRPEGEEFGARGVALLASLHAGLMDAAAFERAAEDLSIARTFKPDMEAVAGRLARYRACRDLARRTGRMW